MFKISGRFVEKAPSVSNINKNFDATHVRPPTFLEKIKNNNADTVMCSHKKAVLFQCFLN